MTNDTITIPRTALSQLADDLLSIVDDRHHPRESRKHRIENAIMAACTAKERAEDYAVVLASQARNAAQIVAYVVERELFDGPCPSSCNGCNHTSCKENEREWERMRELAAKVVANAPVPVAPKPAEQDASQKVERCAKCGKRRENYRHIQHPSGHDCLGGCGTGVHHEFVPPAPVATNPSCPTCGAEMQLVGYQGQADDVSECYACPVCPVADAEPERIYCTLHPDQNCQCVEIIGNSIAVATPPVAQPTEGELEWRHNHGDAWETAVDPHSGRTLRRVRKPTEGEALKACPLCGGSATQAGQEVAFSTIKLCRAWCTQCFLMTANYATPDEARASWNRRAAPALDVDALAEEIVRWFVRIDDPNRDKYKRDVVAIIGIWMHGAGSRT
jgi:hypothetical protein